MTRLPSLPSLPGLPGLYGGIGAHRQRRPTYNLAPEEEESLLGTLGQGALSGLSMFARTFGKPGAAVRGTLSGLTGGPWGGGALNLIPFSNTMGITDPDKWVWSRDIMRRAGMVGKKDTWGNFATGFAGDVVTDPLAWTNFGAAGAATKVGRLLEKAGLAKFLPDVAENMAKAAGTKALGPRAFGMTENLSSFLKHLPKEVRATADKALERGALGMKMSPSELTMLKAGDQPLRGLLGLGLPGMTKLPVGAGFPGALRMAKGLDVLGHGIRYSAPVRHMYSGFSKPMEGTITAAAQKGYASAARMKDFKTATMREGLAGDLFELDRMGMLRHDIQGIQDGGVMRKYLEGVDDLPANMESARPILDRIRAKQPEILKIEQYEGMTTGQLMDETVDYMHRQVWRFDKDLSAGGRGGNRAYDATHQAQIQRESVLSGFEKGSDAPNRMSLDKRLTGTAATQAKPMAILGTRVRKAIEEIHAGGVEGQGAAAKRAVRDAFPKRTSAGVDIDAAVNILRTEYADDIAGWSTQKLEGLARFLSELDPQHPATGIPLFAHHPVVDQLARMQYHIRGVENARAARKLMADHARHISEAMPDDVPLAEALAKAGLDVEVGTTRMLDELPASIVDRFKNPPPGVAPPGVAFDAQHISQNVFVPKAIADDLGRLNKAFSSPEWLKPIMKAVDNYTNFFRAHVTTYWVAFAARNGFSGQAQNAIGGAYGPLAGDMMRSVNDGWRILKNGNISGVLEFPLIQALRSHSDPAVRAIARDPALATRKIAELAFAHELGGRMNIEFAQSLGITSQASLGNLAGELPGLASPSLKGTLKKLIPSAENPEWWKPWAVRGVGGRQESKFALSQVGEDAAFLTEFMNRIPPFISYLRRGWDSGAAASRVKLLQVDYMAAASGDQAMRRLIPFFAFLKGQTKFLAQELTSKPGGALAQTIHAEARGQGELPPFSPEYVQTSAAIPGDYLPESIFGKAPADASRVITALGLMHEDPLQFASQDPTHPISSLLKAPLREAAGRFNPLLQWPIEALTGRSLWQTGPRGGRELSTMDPSLGRLISNLTPGHPEPAKLGLLEDIGRLTAGRWISTAKGLSDTRKPWSVKMLNALTGAKVTDIPPAARESRMREQVQALQMGLGGRVFEVTNIPKEAKAAMTPEELKKAEQLELLLKILGERSKRRWGKG